MKRIITIFALFTLVLSVLPVSAKELSSKNIQRKLTESISQIELMIKEEARSNLPSKYYYASKGNDDYFKFGNEGRIGPL